MRAIDGDALIEKLGIAKECNDCKQNEEPYCRWKPDVVDICEAINDAPTIEPERKKGMKELPSALTTGKWLIYEVANDEDEHPIAWECDACGAVVDCKTKFCPECGNEKEV